MINLYNRRNRCVRRLLERARVSLLDVTRAFSEACFRVLFVCFVLFFVVVIASSQQGGLNFF